MNLPGLPKNIERSIPYDPRYVSQVSKSAFTRGQGNPGLICTSPPLLVDGGLQLAERGCAPSKLSFGLLSKGFSDSQRSDWLPVDDESSGSLTHGRRSEHGASHRILQSAFSVCSSCWSNRESERSMLKMEKKVMISQISQNAPRMPVSDPCTFGLCCITI